MADCPTQWWTFTYHPNSPGSSSKSLISFGQLTSSFTRDNHFHLGSSSLSSTTSIGISFTHYRSKQQPKYPSKLPSMHSYSRWEMGSCKGVSIREIYKSRTCCGLLLGPLCLLWVWEWIFTLIRFCKKQRKRHWKTRNNSNHQALQNKNLKSITRVLIVSCLSTFRTLTIWGK